MIKIGILFSDKLERFRIIFLCDKNRHFNVNGIQHAALRSKRIYHKKKKLKNERDETYDFKQKRN